MLEGHILLPFSGKSKIPGLQMVIFSLHPLVADSKHSLLLIVTNPFMGVPSSYCHLNLITCPRSSLQTPSHWGSVLQHMNFEGTQIFSPSHTHTRNRTWLNEKIPDTIFNKKLCKSLLNFSGGGVKGKLCHTTQGKAFSAVETLPSTPLFSVSKSLRYPTFTYPDGFSSSPPSTISWRSSAYLPVRKPFAT